MAILFNPTDRDLEYHHNSVLYKIPAGEEVTSVPDRAANHLVTNLGTRGLIKIDVEDVRNPSEMEKKTRLALVNQEKFEKAQLENFNRVNLDLADKKRKLNKPSEEIIAFSEKWEIPIDEPYTVRNKGVQVESIIEPKEAKQLDIMNVVSRVKKIQERHKKLDQRTLNAKDIALMVDRGELSEAEEELTRLGV